MMAGNPEVVTKFEGTKATPEFLQAIAYEVYVKSVTFGLLHRWLSDMGMRVSVNTLDKFGNNIFAYTKDGNYPIDNNIAERSIRPLTTRRNSMLHFGSDEGAEMAATYHSIISTVKLQGRSAWEYLGKFFTKIFNGCRDFVSLRPDKIGLAVCQ